MAHRYIKLSGPALELARIVSEEWRSLHDDIAKLESDAINKIEERKTAGNLVVKGLMNKLFEEIGIPVEQRSSFFLDARYLNEHGDAFICPTSGEASSAVVQPHPPKHLLN